MESTGNDPIWKALPAVPRLVCGAVRIAEWKKDPAVLKDDRLLNWCPFQLVLCQLMLALVQRSCNLGARCEAFLFHLVPQHLQKPHASHLRQQHSVGNRCTGRDGRKCHSWVMNIKKKKNPPPHSSEIWAWELGGRVFHHLRMRRNYQVYPDYSDTHLWFFKNMSFPTLELHSVLAEICSDLPSV